MRHKQNSQRLSRFTSYYKATIRSLARAVLINQRIVTTKLRAKLAKRLVDNLVNLGKQINSLPARRRAYSYLNDHALVKKLFNDIAPAFTESHGGYTRIIPYKRRRGDNAELVVLELSKMTTVVKPVKEKKPVTKTEEERVKTQIKEAKPEHKPEPKEVVPPVKEKHKKEPQQKPSKKMLGGFGKFFKSERDSL